jgi:Uma2 family endonuclease
MSILSDALELKLVRKEDDLELDLLPLQGLWTEDQYLKLSGQTNRLIEYTNGVIEVLPMPTRKHQVILALLYELCVAFVRPRGGKVLFSPLRVRITPHHFREPDLVVLIDADDPRNQEAIWFGADLVFEIVSPDHPSRDTVEKRRDYAEAAIPEYWIVDPIDETITVLVLDGDTYSEHGVFQRGTRAISRLLEGFQVDVAATFDAK